jgi:NTP pyrophosphatase (non-canonical NTP hydrolase)
MPETSVIIPDIPISEYPDVGPSPRVVHFWERPHLKREIYNPVMLDEDEVGLVEKNISFAVEMSAIQREVGEWAWKNFKEKAMGLNPYLGIIEEIGELSKAILKKDQGIRGTPEKHDEDAVDAIGDIAIYLFNYLNCEKIDVYMIACTIFLNRIDMSCTDDNGLVPCDPKNNRKEIVIMMARAVASMRDDSKAVSGLLIYLQVMAKSYGTDLLSVVRKTWDIVKRRNWVEDSMVGGGHTH